MRWDYATLVMPADNKEILNKLAEAGNDGWENYAVLGGIAAKEENGQIINNSMLFFFKRSKE